jgi:hypothetical protein
MVGDPKHLFDHRRDTLGRPHVADEPNADRPARKRFNQVRPLVSG